MIETIIVVALLFLFWLLLNARKKRKGPKAEKEISNEEIKAQKPTKRKQKQKETDYISIFMSNSNIKARSGKLIYIRPEYHEKGSKIIHVIGKNEISIFSYIDNVLTHHFEEFQEEIIRSYRENNTDIF
ncbi:MAG: DUF3408 domain-containing protein [Bacteroidetes bacterium]|nr:DUF3408 domain-containing protein [Bacteroidota bacterium]